MFSRVQTAILYALFAFSVLAAAIPGGTPITITSIPPVTTTVTVVCPILLNLSMFIASNSMTADTATNQHFYPRQSVRHRLYPVLRCHDISGSSVACLAMLSKPLRINLPFLKGH